jgi:hypothetical protein
MAARIRPLQHNRGRGGGEAGVRHLLAQLALEPVGGALHALGHGGLGGADRLGEELPKITLEGRCHPPARRTFSIELTPVGTACPRCGLARSARPGYLRDVAGAPGARARRREMMMAGG